MSELKRSQSLYSQPPPAARADFRGTPTAVPPMPARPVTEAVDLCLLESWETGGPQGGDPYNGIGARAHLAARNPRK